LELAVRTLGADLDRDGDVDIVAVGKVPGELAVYENRDSSWVKMVLTTGFLGGWALALADVDQDGDPDIVAGASALGEPYWWENTSLPQAGVAQGLAGGMQLSQNTPNPLTHGTSVRYWLPTAGRVQLSLYDVTGQLARVPGDDTQEARRHTVEMGANGLQSGVYFCRLASGQQTLTRRMLLLSSGTH
jgi:hypothetical protein